MVQVGMFHLNPVELGNSYMEGGKFLRKSDIVVYLHISGNNTRLTFSVTNNAECNNGTAEFGNISELSSCNKKNKQKKSFAF